MAMRGRGGRGNPNRPQRLISGRVYEQFKPMSERRQEDDYDTLLIYLPGFQKEYIKVTTEDLNIVRVRGERLIAENKWSRFQEDYRVPENCEMRGIRARFDGGILTITMPRKIINAPPPPPPPTTTTPVTPKTEEQPFRRTKQEETLPKPKEEPKEKKPDKPQTTPLDEKTLPPQPKPTSSSTPTKQEPLKPAPEAKEVVESTIGSLPKYAPKKDKHDVVEKPSVGEKTDLDEGKGKEALLEKETMRDFKGNKGKPNYGGVTSGGLWGNEPEDNKKVVTRSWMVNEDRKALVNVGVGVLVIVALGVHVSYTIGLISKGK